MKAGMRSQPNLASLTGVDELEDQSLLRADSDSCKLERHLLSRNHISDREGPLSDVGLDVDLFEEEAPSYFGLLKLCLRGRPTTRRCFPHP